MEDIVEIIADKRCREVLQQIQRTPLGAIEIHERTKIPIAAIYRLLKKMEKCGLVVNAGTKLVGAKRADAFYSVLSHVTINFDNSNLRVDLERKDVPFNFEDVYIHEYKKRGTRKSMAVEG